MFPHPTLALVINSVYVFTATFTQHIPVTPFRSRVTFSHDLATWPKTARGEACCYRELIRARYTTSTTFRTILQDK